jgi:peroxiredoxin Q/BCP
VILKRGYEVLGVSTDSEKSHKKFIEKEKLPFRLLADTEKMLHSSYGTWVEKSMYGRKYMGTARKTFVIDENGVIEEIIDKVDTKNHSAQILKNGIDKSIVAKVKGASVAKKAAKKKVAKKVVSKTKTSSARKKK